MKLIVGLGNPGTVYNHTPHNLGFAAVDLLRVSFQGSPLTLKARFHALVSEGHLGREKIIFAEPQTMMNASGTSVKSLCAFYRIHPNNLWVIHDDLDLAETTIRHSFDSRSAGHRGVQSIIDDLGTKAFHRIRIGVGKPDIPADVFVLRPATRAVWHRYTEALQAFTETFSALLTQPEHGMEKGARHHQPPRGKI